VQILSVQAFSDGEGGISGFSIDFFQRRPYNTLALPRQHVINP